MNTVTPADPGAAPALPETLHKGAALTCKVVLFELPLRLAVITAAVAEVTDFVATANEALLAPAAKAKDDGTSTAAELDESWALSATAVAFVRVTVHEDGEPPVTAMGLHTIALSAEAEAERVIVPPDPVAAMLLPVASVAETALRVTGMLVAVLVD